MGSLWASLSIFLFPASLGILLSLSLSTTWAPCGHRFLYSPPQPPWASSSSLSPPHGLLVGITFYIPLPGHPPLSLHHTGSLWASLSLFLSPASLRHKETPAEEREPFSLLRSLKLLNDLLRAPLVTCNPNLQNVITHVSHVWRMNEWIKNEWSAQSAIWSLAFRPSTPCNLFMHVLTIWQVKFTQSTVLEQKRLDLWSLSLALSNLWLYYWSSISFLSGNLCLVLLFLYNT